MLPIKLMGLKSLIFIALCFLEINNAINEALRDFLFIFIYSNEIPQKQQTHQLRLTVLEKGHCCQFWLALLHYSPLFPLPPPPSKLTIKEDNHKGNPNSLPPDDKLF